MECIFDDERGWTVIQNRYAGEVCFNRDWDSYRMGFGCPVGIGEYLLVLHNFLWYFIKNYGTLNGLD